MDNNIKKDLLENLRTNKAFSSALDNVKDAEERRKIKSFAEDFYLKFIEGLLTAKKIVEENPEKVVEVGQERIHKQ